MRVALVHDYLYDYGGGERVLEALHELWPKAPVLTSWVDWTWLRTHKPEWQSWDIRSSWFQWVPFKRRLTSPLRFLAPLIWESFDLSRFDVVISSDAWFMCKGVVVRPGAVHVCYCHTPPRFLYGYPTARRQSTLARAYAILINPFMRYYDFVSAQKVHVFVANSENTKRRIEKFYRRQARVVYPPVSIATSDQRLATRRSTTKPYTLNTKPYFLMVNRLVKPKRVDVAIEAAKRAGVRLKIAGTGREEKRLRQLAAGTNKVELLGYVPDSELASLYAGARAVLYLAEEEDFGITPVEAMAYGKPVIAAKSGGVIESVIDGKTGILLEKVSVTTVTRAIETFRPGRFRVTDCQTQARRFSKEQFKRKMRDLVEPSLTR